jgi:predicted RNA-binding protein
MEWKNQLVETNKENIKLKTKIFYKPLFIISTNNKLNDDIKIIYHKIINTSINFTNEFLSLFKTILDCSSTLKDNYNKMLIENDKYFLLNYKINKIKLSSLNFNSIDNKYISLL